MTVRYIYDRSLLPERPRACRGDRCSRDEPDEAASSSIDDFGMVPPSSASSSLPAVTAELLSPLARRHPSGPLCHGHGGGDSQISTAQIGDRQ